MDHRKKLRAYIADSGGIKPVSWILGAAEQTLRGILNGWRGVSKSQAEKWEKRSRGALKADELIWIRATKKERPRKSRPADRKKK